MLLNDTHEIAIAGRTVSDVIADIAEKCQSRESLQEASLLLTQEEEFALDQIKGLFWPLLFTVGLKARIMPDDHDVKIAASIKVVDDGFVQVRFLIE